MMAESSFVRTEPIDFRPFQKQRCADAQAFAAWIDQTFAEVLKEPTSADLDRVMLRIAQEYLLRRRGVPVHRKALCLLDVLHERMDALWERQRSLAQGPSFESHSNQPTYPAIPAVFFAQREEE